MSLVCWPEARCAHKKFRHSNWITPPLAARVGLHQGCSTAPMLFRWVLQDALRPLHRREWKKAEVCACSHEHAHVAWPVDTWLLDATRAGLECMIRGVAETANRETDLAIRCEACSVVRVAQRASAAATHEPAWVSFPLLAKTSIVAEWSCTRLLGAVLHVGHGCMDEWSAILYYEPNTGQPTTVAACSGRSQHTPCTIIGCCKMATCSVRTWCSASRYWNRAELQSVRTMQIRTSRRALSL